MGIPQSQWSYPTECHDSWWLPLVTKNDACKGTTSIVNTLWYNQNYIFVYLCNDTSVLANITFCFITNSHTGPIQLSKLLKLN